MVETLNAVLVAVLVIPGAVLATYVAYRHLTSEKATDTSRNVVWGAAAVVLIGLFFGGSPLVALCATVAAGATVVAVLTGSEGRALKALANLASLIG